MACFELPGKYQPIANKHGENGMCMQMNLLCSLPCNSQSLLLLKSLLAYEDKMEVAKAAVFASESKRLRDGQMC